MINSFINTYFGFNRQQRNGLFVLILISFTLLVVRIVYPFFITPDEILIRNLPLIERKTDSAYTASNTFNNKKYKDNASAKLFVFNPNTVSYEQLLTLGFREKTAKTFLKFRDKGFVFKQKKDLQKIYGISGDFYTKLEPYVLIEPLKTGEPGKAKGHESNTAPAAKQAQPKIELNACDSVTLIALKGIGPSYAKRILKYRSILGGYVSIEQLKEVYGFPPELFESIKPLVTADAALVKKLDLNKDDFKTINKHPYLSYEITKTIFDWRRKTSINATNLKDILNDEALYQKVLPYLDFG